MNNNQDGNKTTKNARKKWVVGTAIAAISLMAMGTSALASTDKAVFKEFFNGNGNTEISRESATLINQSKVTAGIKTTVEESIIGENSAMIIVSFENEDGMVFPQDAAIATPELNWAKDASYMVEQRVTEDGKKIIAMFDVDTPSPLKGNKVTIKADAVVNSTGAVIAKGPFQNTFTAQESSTSYNIGIDQTLSQQQEKLSIQTINISMIGIGIEGNRLDGQTDQLPKYNPKVSISTSDGKDTELHFGSASTLDQGFKWNYNLDQEGKKVFLNTAKITSISIDGHIIPVTK